MQKKVHKKARFSNNSIVNHEKKMQNYFQSGMIYFGFLKIGIRIIGMTETLLEIRLLLEVG